MYHLPFTTLTMHQVCSAAPLVLTYDARTRTISSWSSHSGEPVQNLAWSFREIRGAREGDGPIVSGGVTGDADGEGSNGCAAGDKGDKGDAAGDVGDAAEEERGARPLLSVYGSQAVLALGSKLTWLGAPHLPQAWLRRQRECEAQLLQAARMQLPLAADSFVCKLVRAWLQLGPPTDSPQKKAAWLCWAVASPRSVSLSVTAPSSTPAAAAGQVRLETLEHPLGVLLRARVSAFTARFTASRGGAATKGEACYGADGGADGGGNGGGVDGGGDDVCGGGGGGGGGGDGGGGGGGDGGGEGEGGGDEAEGGGDGGDGGG